MCIRDSYCVYCGFNCYNHIQRMKLDMAQIEHEMQVIADSGIGIRPEDLPRVFERGYTGKLGRVDQRSTGIGLYLCRRTLSQLGHTISIQSTPGKGTAVSIHLQRRDLPLE